MDESFELCFLACVLGKITCWLWHDVEGEMTAIDNSFLPSLTSQSKNRSVRKC